MLLYIDPGTGSMLFTILIGLITTLFFLFQKLTVKLRFLLHGGNVKVQENQNKIPLLIFSEGKQYWVIFKPVCDELERRGVDTVFWTADENDPAISTEYQHIHTEFIGEGNKAFAKLNMANADVLLATTPGLDVFQWKRSKNVRWYVHILHSVDDSTSYRMFGLDHYDAVLMSGQYQIDEQRELEKLRNLPSKKMLVVGSTYLDTMKARKENEQSDEAVSGDKQKTILLAPSWGDSSILCRWGDRILTALKETGYTVIVRPHPQSFVSDKSVIEPLMNKYQEKDGFFWNRDKDNFDCLKKADIMITDFSSIMYDYTLVFDKPLIYADTKFDISPYDAAWLDEEPWKFQVLPKLGHVLREEDFPHMKKLIDEISDSEEFAAGREEARQHVWQHIGQAAQLTADYLLTCMDRNAASEDAAE